MSVRVGAMIAFVSRVSFAESGCAATPAPPGYVGDCPGGTTCSTFISCAAGYNSSSYSFPGALCYGGGSFYYYGCSMPSSVCVCTCLRCKVEGGPACASARRRKLQVRFSSEETKRGRSCAAIVRMDWTGLLRCNTVRTGSFI